MKRILLFFFLLTTASAYSTNYAGSFNGTNASVNLGSTVGNAGLRSMEFWFKPAVTIGPSTSAVGWTFFNRNDGTQAHEYEIYIRGTDWNSVGGLGYLYFAVRYNGQLHEIHSNSNTWTAGTWYHVAGVLDPSAGMMLYINGVQQTMTDPAATQPVEVDNVNSTTLGRWASTRYFYGLMEEMRFWNRAISSSEINTKMCSDLNPANETGLVGYWKFDEGSGGTLVDQTGSYNGTISSMTWVGDSPCPSSASNYVMRYDGSGDYIDLGTSVGNAGLRSMEFWFRPAVTINSSTSALGWTFFNRNDGTQAHEYEIYIRGTDWNSVGGLGYLYFAVRYNGQLHEIHSNSNSWTAGTWYHVAGVIDSVAGMSLYINGVQQTMTDAAATQPVEVDNANSTTLGTWAMTRYFQGDMDELRFWNRSISSTEINTKMCSDLNSANETGLVGYWKFNEGSGAIIVDSSTVPHNGNVYNATWVQDIYCVTGVETLQQAASPVLVFPNPFNDVFTVQTDLKAATIEVYDNMGRLVLSQSATGSSTTIHLENMASGVYLLRVISEADKEILYEQKLLKQ